MMTRQPRRTWTEEEQRALAGLAATDMSPAEIAARLGRSLASVAVRMSRTGLRRQDPITRDQIDRIVALYERGFSNKRIALALGIGSGRVAYVVRIQHAIRPTSVVSDLRRDFDDEITSLSIAGMPVRDIARRVGQPTWRVRSRLTTLARRDAVLEARREAGNRNQNAGRPAEFHGASA